MEGPVIEVNGLTKRFGDVTAVDDLSFSVYPGRVTGFLGPNGAGKTTTLRIVLGLVKATAGTATIGGRVYPDLDRPLTHVGAALEAASFHPGRTARNHLKIQAAASGIPASQVQVVLDQTGMSSYADRRVGGYSMGMRQRLGLAGALLGNPGVMVLDEPTNGLDPEGIRWMREFLRALAAQGRTVLVSSHLLSEVQQSVDDVVIISRGRMVRSGPLAQLEAERPSKVRVDGPDRAALGMALQQAGMPLLQQPHGEFLVDGRAGDIGAIAYSAGIQLSLLSPVSGGLEELFLEVTGGVR